MSGTGYSVEPVPESIAAALSVLCALFNADKEADTLRAFARLLQKRHVVAGPLLEAAVERCLEHRRFFPSVAEFLEDVEHVRTRLLAGRPHEPCDACRSNPGWIETTAAGELVVRWLGKEQTVRTSEATRLQRCACWVAWQNGLRVSGLLGPAAPGSQAAAQPANPGIASTGHLATRFKQRMRVVSGGRP